ncbi:hypothetical protein MGA3_11740 [Bacillus methanolicus MGA3]|uniref:RadC-like JAB domain-containing protein n=1 Tax=Bacillus methanolicus (strain MGA3 / ATCC 53907) TaxID=796606 RepID=I3E392_BACMM|nr:hypothetical protein BMMGA3_02400 [Bacillus methanolicus MGA3]EIJ80963.1 hypothetical protein MGA3_11740 [Bacillus methanolicus MGA3]
MQPIFEVLRIKQEIREVSASFVVHKIYNQKNVAELATAYIADEDREVFLVMMLNTKMKWLGFTERMSEA